MLVPRFLNDQELRAVFGLSERALRRLRFGGRFPRRDTLINKTDRRAVDYFFDQRAGLPLPQGTPMDLSVDGEENFDGF